MVETKEWLVATCPYCGERYSYLKDYKPATCNKFKCLQLCVVDLKQKINK